MRSPCGCGNAGWGDPGLRNRSAAAAAAAHGWGLVGETVDVHNPGGTLQVSLERRTVRLKGPVRKVAEIDVDRQEILAAARP